MLATKALCAAHSSAFWKLIDAKRVAAQLPMVREPRIAVWTVYDNGADKQIAVYTHAQLDEVCNAYIEHCRKAGRWGAYHQPQLGRMDEHGVFHDIHAQCCPTEGDVLNKRGPILAFTDSSLEAYRVAIEGYHMKLADKFRIVEAADRESGALAAAGTASAASEVEHTMWNACLIRVAEGTRADIRTICGHASRLASAHLRRHLAVEPGDRTMPSEEMLRMHDEKAGEIVAALKATTKRSK